MSYSLIAYDKQAAPKPRHELLAWLQAQLVPDGHSASYDPASTSVGLRNWRSSMAARFPPLNGPDALPETDFDYATDYHIGRKHIYARFPTATGTLAAEVALAQARRWGVGLYDPAEERILRT